MIGDFGVGVKRAGPDRRQQQVADALERAVDAENVRLIITTGDNIYAGSKFLGIPIGETGREDDDWFFTYFQPYRYIINRIPVYPSIGNHDADESEDCDDRGQVEDNFYICERMAGEEAAGRASFTPGLFYRFRYGADIEFVCLDTSKEDFFRDHRLFEFPKHWRWSRPRSRRAASAAAGPRWRFPSRITRRSAPVRSITTPRRWPELLPLFERVGRESRVQRPRAQLPALAGRRHRLLRLRRGRQSRATGAPNRFDEAHTQSWSNQCHFLLARIDGDSMPMRAIGELTDAADAVARTSNG